MSKSPKDIEQRLARAARAFPYPPTPNLVSAVRQPAAPRPHLKPRGQPVWAVVVTGLVLLGLLAVPPVRAQLWSWLRIGSVEIAIRPTPLPSANPTRHRPVGTSTPAHTPAPGISPSVLELAGETTLAEAQETLGFAVPLPTYPGDLGPPQRVFVQRLGAGRSVILVWLEPNTTDHVRLALYLLSDEALARKTNPDIVKRTAVNGNPAVWVQGPHLLEFPGRDDVRLGQLVTGNVLIWTEEQLTYRLETGLSLAETLRIAASLR